MMNLALQERNVYENFDLASDILYFKIGSQGIVSFHGRNYNIKKRMTADQIKKLVSERSFYPINSNCHINIDKIKSIDSGTIYFGSEYSDSKQVSVNRRKQYVIQQLFSQRSANKEMQLTP